MSSSEHSQRRKHRFIDRKQQVRFAVEVGLYSMILPLFFLVLTIGAHFSTWLLGIDARIVHPFLHEYLLFIADNWWGILLALAWLGYVSIWFSHKIFGPMYRFESAMRQKRSDPAQPVHCKLRKGDYFRDFSEHFEEFLNRSTITEAPPPGGGEDDPSEASETSSST